MYRPEVEYPYYTPEVTATTYQDIESTFKRCWSSCNEILCLYVFSLQRASKFCITIVKKRVLNENLATITALVQGKKKEHLCDCHEKSISTIFLSSIFFVFIFPIYMPEVVWVRLTDTAAAQCSFIDIAAFTIVTNFLSIILWILFLSRLPCISFRFEGTSSRFSLQLPQCLTQWWNGKKSNTTRAHHR